MDNIRILLNRLSKNLGTIKQMIGIENKSNNTELNVLLETKFLDILNITEGLNLVNINTLVSNVGGIDGIDKKNRVMVQITSQFSSRKIEPWHEVGGCRVRDAKAMPIANLRGTAYLNLNERL